MGGEGPRQTIHGTATHIRAFMRPTMSARPRRSTAGSKPELGLPSTGAVEWLHPKPGYGSFLPAQSPRGGRISRPAAGILSPVGSIVEAASVAGQSDSRRRKPEKNCTAFPSSMCLWPPTARAFAGPKRGQAKSAPGTMVRGPLPLHGREIALKDFDRTSKGAGHGGDPGRLDAGWFVARAPLSRLGDGDPWRRAGWIREPGDMIVLGRTPHRSIMFPRWAGWAN